MIILELFAGTRSVSKAFERHGHTAYTVDWDKQFENITAYEDVSKLTAERVLEICGGVSLMLFGLQLTVPHIQFQQFQNIEGKMAIH